MERTYVLLGAVALVLATGCGPRQPAGDIDDVTAPISPGLAELDSAAIEQMEANERQKIADLQRQLRDEELKQTDCATALDRLQALSKDRDGLAARLRSLAAQHGNVVAAIQRYGSELSHWSQGFSATVSAKQPEWAAITNMSTYAAAEADVSGLATDVTAEPALADSYGAVRDSLEGALATVVAVLAQLDPLAQAENRCVNLASVLSDPRRWGHNLLGELEALREAYRATLATLAGVHSKRHNAAAVVQAAWQRLLRVSLYNVHMTQANGLLSDTFNALNDAPTYFEVDRQIDESLARYKDLFYRHYSPNLARRVVAVTRVLVADIERNLPGLPITDANRSDLRAKLSGTESTLDALDQRLDRLTDRDHGLFGSRRKLLAGRTLTQQATDPSDGCTVLVEQSAQPSIDGELSYAEFRRKCTDGGAK